MLEKSQRSALSVPGHGQDGPLLVVVAVTLVDVLLEHSQDSHHANGLLPGTVDAVFVSIQHTQSVIGRLQTVKAGLDEVFMNLNLQRRKREHQDLTMIKLPVGDRARVPD